MAEVDEANEKLGLDAVVQATKVDPAASEAADLIVGRTGSTAATELGTASSTAPTPCIVPPGAKRPLEGTRPGRTVVATSPTPSMDAIAELPIRLRTTATPGIPNAASGTRTGVAGPADVPRDVPTEAAATFPLEARVAGRNAPADGRVEPLEAALDPATETSIVGLVDAPGLLADGLVTARDPRLVLVGVAPFGPFVDSIST